MKPGSVQADDQLLTIHEACAYLKLARQTIYNMVNRGDIPYLKAGKALRFRKSALDAWLEQSAAGDPKPIAS